MAVWAAKDPQAVADYTYTIPLDTGDSVASYTLQRLTGTVAIDSDSIAGADVTAWLSGGVDGETDVFRIAWITVGGREDDDVITLLVSSHEYEALALTGYAKPSAQHLKQRYPAFSSVDAGTVHYWLTDAERSVDTSWTETDYAPALMALAAHNMAISGLGTDPVALAGVAPGVTRLQSASMSVSLTEAAANALVTGGFAATRYGQEYDMLLRRNRGGPIVQDTGEIPADDVSYTQRWYL